MKQVDTGAVLVISALAGFCMTSAVYHFGHFVTAERATSCSDADRTDAAAQSRTAYSVNADGLTFGSGAVTDDLPDLIAVVGDHGVMGYVYTAEYLAAPADFPAGMNVYKSDGKTVIDTYTEIP